MTKSNRYCTIRRRPLIGIRLYLLIVCLVLLFILLTGGTVGAQSANMPEGPPDGATGLELYGARCANCHGPRGMGDGSDGINSPKPPTAHASPEFLRAAVPADMFTTITDGRIANGMPPFGPVSSNPISEADRWNLIAAIYSLGTPSESLSMGKVVYEDNCLACHGESGQGDGPDAANLDADPGDLTSMELWLSTSNQALYNLLVDTGPVPDHDYELDEVLLWSVVDHLRAFNYEHSFRPIEHASVSGQVINATTGELGKAGDIVYLTAISQDFRPTLTLSSTLDVEGRYYFELTDASIEWYWQAGLTYQDIDFSSNIDQLSAGDSDLDLPITIYELTTDPGAISVDQHHIFINFTEDSLQIGELYVVSNSEPMVFIGQNGDPDQGTFEIAVPAGAENLLFERGFESLDSFIPIENVVPVDGGWADTWVVRPGNSTLSLMVQYTLPYEDGASVSHLLKYPTTTINLPLPDVGVSLDLDDGWVPGQQAAMGGGSFTSYTMSNLAAGSELTMAFEGRPRPISGATTVERDNTTELLVGGLVAVAVIGIAVVVISRWRREPEEELDRDELLELIAGLDDAYEMGEIAEDEYLAEREGLLAELKAIWEQEG